MKIVELLPLKVYPCTLSFLVLLVCSSDFPVLIFFIHGWTFNMYAMIFLSALNKIYQLYMVLPFFMFIE